MAWKECAWYNINSVEDNGEIKVSLTVTFAANGAECRPIRIDGVVYLWKGKITQNHQRVRHIEGHCSNIDKGQVRVGFRVGNCQGYGGTDVNVNTGRNSASRLFIEEVPAPQN
ncbi:hypothetical protein QZH41_018204 [Actinostola sp. cb2023]|nr:hypothetical protein QZH41_018204 [Actinostola sp. cb2023]